MARKYFGTDGIRGRANGDKLTPELALKVGMAAGLAFRRSEVTNRVVIGKDTRRSGYMLENALTAGFTAVGMDVLLLGPMPTPAVAMLTTSMRADIGVMISASHNPFDDNGIKLFGPDGFKLNDQVEVEIERLLDSDLSTQVSTGRDIGRAKRVEEARTRYVEYAKRTLPRDVDFSGMRIVIDCANGAAYKTAPEVLWELGAEVISIGISPDGYNINEGVGSTAPEALVQRVREFRADIGIALDGDADRVLIVDEKGNIVDGDQLMAAIASYWHAKGQLRGGGVVATVMSNLGLERYIQSLGLTLERTQVGDRYVLEAMRTKGYNVGGEQSGHIVLTDFTTTGDGLVAALQLLALVKESGGTVSDVCHKFTPVPQLLKNVRFKNSKPLENPKVREKIAAAEEVLKAAGGRILIRNSGTEPLIRVMAEGDDAYMIAEKADGIIAEIENAA